MNLFEKKHAWILGGFEYLHADDVVANAGSGGATFRTDQLGTGQHVPFTKLMSGTADDTAVIPGDATNGLFVQVKASAAVPVTDNGGTLSIDDGAGSITVDGTVTANAGTGTFAVSAASLPLPSGAATAAKQPALGTAGTASSDVITVQGIASMTALKVDGSAVTQPVSDGGGNLSVDDGAGSLTVDAPVGTPVFVRLSDGAAAISTLPVSLASVPSHAVTNAGTFATQESGAALTSLQLIDDVVLAEDAAHVSGDKGVMALAVRKDVAAALAGTDGDYIPLTTDSTGALRVTGGGGGTQYQEDAAHTSGDTGTLSLAVRRDANTSLVDATGDYAPLQVDSSGNLKVAIISGAGSGGTSATDDAAFSVASGSGTPIMGLADETAPDSVDEGDVGVVRMTLARALHVNLRDSSGNELTSGAQYAEDAAHASGDLGTLALVVRKDTATQVAGTDGDYSALVNDASGRLHVNVGALPSGTVAGGSSLPAGTNNIGDVDVLTVPTDPFGANADAASATGSISAKLRFIASTGIPITGTVTVGAHAVTNAGTFAVQDSEKVADNAGFTDGTTKVLPAGYIFDEVAGTALTENDAAAARIDSKRAQVMVFEDATTRGQRAAVSSAGALSVTDIPATSGGWTSSVLLSAATTNATSLKGSAGQLGGWYLYNANAAVRYLKFYNKATAPTVGTDTPVLVIPVPPGSAANVEFGKGIAFATGIAYALTTGVANSDTTAVAANEIVLNLFYK